MNFIPTYAEFQVQFYITFFLSYQVTQYTSPYLILLIYRNERKILLFKISFGYFRDLTKHPSINETILRR